MKRRNSKFFKEKKIIALKIADDENRNAIRSQGYIELEKPIHDGYYADYVLRNDILNRADADMFQEALDLCKKQAWCKDKSFMYRDYKTKKWLDIKPSLSKIDKVQYDALSSGAKRFFYESTIKDKYWKPGFTNKYYICTLSYELKIVITKAYITHRREHDSVLYKTGSNIEKQLNLLTDGHPYGGSTYKYWNRILNKRIKIANKLEAKNIEKIYNGVSNKNDLLDR